MTDEISPAGLGNLQSGVGARKTPNTSDLIGITLRLALNVSLDILTGLFWISGDIKGIAGSFWNGKTVVEGDAARNGAKADDGTPHLVGGFSTNTGAVTEITSRGQSILEAGSGDQGQNSACKLTNTLHGKDGTLEVGVNMWLSPKV